MSRVFERLSSGQRINRAADDPAGLAASLSLDLKSRVYTQGIRNANDGISAVNIADGTLNELSNVLGRLSELATSAANGSLSRIQRLTLDTEATQLTSEFNRLLSSTEFNGQKILDGSFAQLAVQLGFGTNESLRVGIGSKLAQRRGDGSFTGEAASFGVSDASGTQVSGDFNGDGFLDVALATLWPGQVDILYGTGDGTFNTATVTMNGGVAIVSDLAVADVDNDGRDDLIGNRGGTLSLIRGSASGLGSASTVATGISDFVVADFNGDGRADIVSSSGSSISFWSGLGTGSFSAGATTSAGLTVSALVSGDFNGDGIVDVAATNGTAVRVLTGTSSGTFALGASSTVTSLNVGNLKARDLNHDGIDDLVWGDGTHLRVSMGSSGGAFGSTQSYATSSIASDFSIVDVNGDGNLDLARANSSNGVSYLLNDGAGGFNDQRTFATTVSALTTLAAGDFNGDGVVDFLALSEDPAFTGYRFYSQNTTNSTSIARLDLTTAANARSSLSTIDRISARLAQERGQLGASLSRLSSALNTLTSQRDETSAASSRIRDADIGAEASERVRLSIVQSAATSLLAQANLAPQIALSLLRSA